MRVTTLRAYVMSMETGWGGERTAVARRTLVSVAMDMTTLRAGLPVAFRFLSGKACAFEKFLQIGSIFLQKESF